MERQDSTFTYQDFLWVFCGVALNSHVPTAKCSENYSIILNTPTGIGQIQT